MTACMRAHRCANDAAIGTPLQRSYQPLPSKFFSCLFTRFRFRCLTKPTWVILDILVLEQVILRVITSSSFYTPSLQKMICAYKKRRSFKVFSCRSKAAIRSISSSMQCRATLRCYRRNRLVSLFSKEKLRSKLREIHAPSWICELAETVRKKHTRTNLWNILLVVVVSVHKIFRKRKLKVSLFCLYILYNQ